MNASIPSVSLLCGFVAMSFGVMTEPAIALSLACCESLTEMETETDLIIRGKALMGVEDLKKIHLTQAEHEAMQARDEKIPMGSVLVVHDGQWQHVESYMIFPVEVMETIEGEAKEKVIGVFHHSSMWTTPMLQGAEYLLFLNRAEEFERSHEAYFDFSGQGKYNLDGKVTQQPGDSVGWLGREAEVFEKYGDRVQFVSAPGRSLLSGDAAGNWLSIVFAKVLQLVEFRPAMK